MARKKQGAREGEEQIKLLETEGGGELMKYKYMFDCKKCTNKVAKNSSTYCISLSHGTNTISATDDYKLICSAYTTKQKQLSVDDYLTLPHHS